MKKIANFVFDNIFSLSKEELNKLTSKDGRANNVALGIDKHLFGVALAEDNYTSIEFDLFYLRYTQRLIGYKIRLSTALENWTKYILAFSNQLSTEHPDNDTINSYNTFLGYIRTILEQLGFFTFTNYDIKEINKQGYKSEILIVNPRGYVLIEYADRLEILRSIFDDYQPPQNNQKKNTVYLMYSDRNKYIKIGKSINPKAREKTLQGDDPELTLLTYWIAESFVEKELHKKYFKKRMRGEWFDLSISDIMEINNYMKQYS